jgi:hypothetical protein
LTISGRRMISASTRTQMSEFGAACALATIEWKNGVPVNLNRGWRRHSSVHGAEQIKSLNNRVRGGADFGKIMRWNGVASAYAESMATSMVTRRPSRPAVASEAAWAPRSTTLTFPGSASQDRTASSCRAGEPSGGGRGAAKIVTLGAAPLPPGRTSRLPPPSPWWRGEDEEERDSAAAATRARKRSRHPARREERSTAPQRGRRPPRRGAARRWCEGSSIWARSAAGGRREEFVGSTCHWVVVFEDKRLKR